jgi:osmotically-inducible protein OsmY
MISDYDRYGEGRAGSHDSDREENHGNYGSSENDFEDYGSSRQKKRGFSAGARRGRGEERGSYGDLGGSYSNTSDQGEYGGGFYSGRADYDEDYEDRNESNRGYSRGNHSRERGGHPNQRRDSANQNRPGNYGQGGMNEYGGGGTYGGYRNRDYSGYNNFSDNPERYGYGRGGHRSDDYGDEDRGWLERAGDEVASWFGYGDDDDRQHRGRGPRNYKRSDERIREDINDRLTDDYYLDASDIEVEVADGDVILSGTVESRRDKRRAEDLAEDVSGVKNVENRLRVKQRNYTSSNQSNSPYGHRTSDTGITNLVSDSATSNTGTSSTSGMTTGNAESTGTITGSSNATGGSGTEGITETGTQTGSTSGTTGGRSRSKSG